MQTITREQLKKQYGITLPTGNFAFKKEGQKYKIYKVYDDSAGCLICGYNTVKGKVLESRKCYAMIDEWLEKELTKGKVYITITD